MDFILAYVGHILGAMLFFGLTLASSFALLIMTKQFLKKQSWITAHLSALLSIICLLPTALVLFSWHRGYIGGGANDATIFAAIIIFLPAVATITWLGLFGISKLIPQQYSYKEFPSFKIAIALFSICIVWLFIFSLQAANGSSKYAEYGTDMNKIMTIHAECGSPADCLSVEYAIMANKHATKELITAIVEAKPRSRIACLAMENPNVTKELIEKWANYGWAFKRCADRILGIRKN